MVRTVQVHREALCGMLRGEWRHAAIATTHLDEEGAHALRPLLSRTGARISLLVDTAADRITGGVISLAALHMLRSLPGCEVRSLPGLTSCLYLLDEGDEALITAAPVTGRALDSRYNTGVIVQGANDAAAQFAAWWAEAEPLTQSRWTDLTLAEATRLEARTIADEIRSLGAFVRVSVHGTRRTRRLDPREFQVPIGAWGLSVRPVEISLYKLDDVLRAKEELEVVLAQRGVEWNGYYLMPRSFIEREWPRIFSARQRHLRDRLLSAEGKVALKAQLAQARTDLAAFFGALYPHVASEGLDVDGWVNQQTTRVLAETVSGSILDDSGLEYRILTILPEDERSVAEVQQMLQDPKLRSVQLTFNF